MTNAAVANDSFSTFPFSTSRGSSPAADTIANFKNVIASRWRRTGHAQLLEQPTLDKIYEIEGAYSNANWGGEEELPISTLSVIDSRDFLESLPTKFRSPDVIPEPNGTLAFEWRYGRYRSLIVSFQGGGNLVYSVIESSNRSNYGNEQFHLGFIPSKISRFLNSLAG